MPVKFNGSKTERAFYGGTFSIFKAVREIGDEGVSEVEAQRRLESLAAEFVEYINKVETRR